MFRKGLLVLTVAAGMASAQFKAVSSPNAAGRLRAHIVVPDRSSWSGVREVSEGATFYDHERFRVSVQPKQSGYFYLFSRNSQGDVQLLYPLHGDGDSYVERNERVALPGEGWLRFDEMAGQEELILIESVEALADVERAIADGDEVDADVVDQYERRPGWDVVVRHMFLEHENR